MNWPLFIFDFIILLPFTLIRLMLIYMFGSRYNVKNYKFIDVMIHAENPSFNRDKDVYTINTIDTINTNIQNVIMDDTTFSNNVDVGVCLDNIEKNIFIKINEEFNNQLDNNLNTDEIKLNNVFKPYIVTEITEIDTDAINSESKDVINVTLNETFNETFNENLDVILDETLNAPLDETMDELKMVDSIIFDALQKLEFDTPDFIDLMEEIDQTELVEISDSSI